MFDLEACKPRIFENMATGSRKCSFDRPPRQPIFGTKRWFLFQNITLVSRTVFEDLLLASDRPYSSLLKSRLTSCREDNGMCDF